MTVLGTNFGKAASDYGTFRAGFPESLFDRLSALGIGLESQRLVDLGTGTGYFGRGFARRGVSVVGVDIDQRMLEQARILDEEEGLFIEYINAPAEATGLEQASCDVVTAGQCWHWFDRSAALAEATRLLISRGKLVIAHFDWLPLLDNVVAATESLIERYNPQWDLGGGNGLHTQWLPGLEQAGFAIVDTFHFMEDVMYSPEAWRGRIRASAGVASLDDVAVEEFDQALADLLAASYPGSELAVPHMVFTIVSEAPNS